ncbi:MAG: uroporphyrinogen-III C-methyltransferase [Rhodospirillales bacterium]|nr:uroporphyrinogen-III C-methyltransferase [Rhodospirillales bacterium]
MSNHPRVYLVGAGPGDPELLTVKAQRLLGEVDVVVYDRLVSDSILDMIPSGTARIFVGKASSHHHLPQDEINELLITLAKNGHSVVRLKGGDPFIFGRGSEEAAKLAENGVQFEVVPGITAASGISSALGIPMTHRGLATGVRFVTGHCRDDIDLDLDWQGLADPNTTLVCYMGLANLSQISEKLVDHGLSPDIPAAAIYRGTAPDQRQCVTTLEKLPSLVRELGFEAPVLIIIGQVVELAGLLNWQGLVYEDNVESTEEEQAFLA